MIRVRLVLLLLLAVILCPKISKAQTASIMTSFRTEREIPDTKKFNAVKAMEVKSGRIISLAHERESVFSHKQYFLEEGDTIYPHFEYVDASYFLLSNDGQTSLSCSYIENVTITDFDYDSVENIIYFCGVYEDFNTESFINIVSWIDAHYLFSTTATQVILYPVNILGTTSANYLKKIDFYRTYSTQQKKLSLISNDNNETLATQGNSVFVFPPSNFITYDISTFSYDIQEISNVRLTGVVHTDTKIAVIGMRGIEDLVIFSHDQENINSYIGKIFKTYMLSSYTEDIQYNVTSLDADMILIGASVKDNIDDERLEFTLVDMLSGINIVYTQSIDEHINDNLDCKSNIIDMQFDREMQILSVLAFNGCDSLKQRDMILQIRPYISTVYPSYIVVPNHILSNYNLLKSLALYGNNKYYLVFGSIVNLLYPGYTGALSGNLYFFDKIAYVYPFNDSSCEQNYSFNIRIIKSKYEPYDIQYDYVKKNVNKGFSHQLHHISMDYEIICNN